MNKSRRMKRKVNMVQPEGGWGWVVVFGVAFTNAFNQSLLSIYGLLFGEKLTRMGEDSVGAALVGNVMLVVVNLSGLIAGPALKTYSARRISIIGSILSGLGLIGASFASEIWHLIATYSVFTGLGIGLLQPATFVAVNDYFTKKRGRAVGISMAGTGIGQMLMPHLVRYLLDHFAYKGCALILGGLAMNGIVGSALFQPVKWHLVPEKDETRPLLGRKPSRLDLSDNSYKVDDDSEEIQHQEETNFGSTSLLIEPEKVQKAEDEKPISPPTLPPPPPSPTVWRRVRDFFDLDLLLDCVFVNITIGCSLGFTSNQSFNMFFPFFLQQEAGLSRSDTAMCMSSLAAADILARLTIPLVTDVFGIASRCSYFVSCVALTAARMVLTNQSVYTWLLVASALNGFSRSPIIVNQNLIVSEHLPRGDRKLPTALGLNQCAKAAAVITLGQLVGWVRDYTGSYSRCMDAQNALLVAVVVLWGLEYVTKKCCCARKEWTEVSTLAGA